MTRLPIALLLILCGATTRFAWADDTEKPAVSLTGFGTLAAVRSSGDRADLVRATTQPNGPGSARRVDLGPDSRLGMQINADLGNRLSAVLQVVSQHQYDNTYSPAVEWANVSYQLSPDWKVRAGRMALPTLAASDYRMVGYATLWVRPPFEAYSILPQTSIDGADFTWRSHPGSWTNSLQGLVGQFRARFPKAGRIEATDSWAITDTLESGPLQFHAAFASTRASWHQPGVDALFAGLNQFGTAVSAIPGLGPTGQQALDLARRYALDGGRVHTLSAGVSFDSGPWLLMAEWVKLTGDGFLADNQGLYATAGYRIGAFTPYVTLARLRSRIPDAADIATAGLPAPLAANAAALNGGVQALLAPNRQTQDSVSLGVRWDVRRDVDVKLQYDHSRLAPGSVGALINYQPGFQSGGTVNVLTLAVDIVF